MRIPLRLSLLSLIISAVALPSISYASCVQQTLQEQLDQADIVVKATITDVTTSAYSTSITATVDRVIKGDAIDSVTFVTASGANMMTSVDVNFVEGKSYKLYLYHDQSGQLTTNRCAGTALLIGTTVLLWILAGAGVVTVLVIGLAIMLRRRKR